MSARRSGRSGRRWSSRPGSRGRRAVYDALAVALEVVGHVRRRFGDVDMEADAEVVAHLGGRGQGRVADGEGRVEAEEGAEEGRSPPRSAGEGGVLLEPLLRDRLAVAVGELVAEAGAEARLLHGLGDEVQGAAHGAGAGVVVDEGRGALPDGVDQHDLGAELDVVEAQLPVQAPPEVLEHLLEVAARRGLAEAPHQGGVEVHVGVDEARHDDLAPGVDDAVEGALDLRLGRDAGDAAALEEQGLVLEHPAGLPKVMIVPFWIRSRIGASSSFSSSGARGRLRQADFGVELVDQPVEVDDLVLEELAPVLGVPLGVDLLVGLPLLLDPGVVLQVVDRLAVRVGQLLEVVDGLPLEAPGEGPGRVDRR